MLVFFEKTPNNAEGGDFMERRPGISGLKEQHDPVEVAIDELQGFVDPEDIDFIRRTKTPLQDQRVGEGNNSRHPERTLIERSEPTSGIDEKRFQQAKP